MESFSGIYYLGEGQPQSVRVSFGLQKMTIHFEDGTGREVFWYYDKILRQAFQQVGTTRVKYLGIPLQTIEVNHPGFAEALQQKLGKNDRSWLRKTFGNGASTLVKVLLVLLALMVSFYIWGIPFLAERLARRVPVSYEEKLGDGMMSTLLSGYTTNDRQTLLLNDFFAEMKIETAYDIHITVVKEDVANAFAVPGGNIVVYDRLLNDMDNYEELAALLSHEFTHIQNKHTTRSLFRSLGSSLFLSMLFGDMGGVMNQAMLQADQLKTLKYSRKLEKEADLDGLKILADRKIDGNGFVGLFKLLEKEVQQSGEDVPAEWISSHPDLKNRIEYIKADPMFNKNGVAKNETLEALFQRMKEDR